MTNKAYRSVIKLMKLKGVSVAVTFTAIAGYIIFSRNGFETIYLIVGVLLFASGSSALNQVQESVYDSVMPRTSMRPIPMGLLTRKDAFLVCAFHCCRFDCTLFGFRFCTNAFRLI